MSDEQSIAPVGEADNVLTDEDALAELIADHGADWVLGQIDKEDLADYLAMASWVEPGPALEVIFEELEEIGYPAPLVKVLREHEQCPWLTPTLNASP